PAAHLFVTIPATIDRLILQRFDLEDALEKSGVDYLVVTSQPPVSVKRGGAFEYTVVVKSKRGGVSYRLDSGPNGMTISKDGKLTWKVPNDWAELETDVIVGVTDSTGQECLHTFTIKIDG